MTLKQVFVINQDLKMGKGKIAVQVAHGEVFYMVKLRTRNCDICMDERYHDWLIDEDCLMKKVVLKGSKYILCDLYEQLTLKNIWCKLVYDRGLTQVPENSFTCLVVEPLEEEMCDKYFAHLKLL